jgi:hypothetical protein
MDISANPSSPAVVLLGAERLARSFMCGMRVSVRVSLYLSLLACFAPAKSRFRADLSAEKIKDMCACLQECTVQGKRLHLLVEEFGVLGSWGEDVSQASPPVAAARESLDELLESGALEDFSWANFRKKSTEKTFSPKDKRTLAVQLGRCLMDFFDFDLNTKHIHLSKGSGGQSRNSVAYLSFSSGITISPEPHIFRMGDPVLLFFAKILLEIVQGKKIPVDISPLVEDNKDVWIDLLNYVDHVEKACQSSYYLEAVRECLLLHSRLPRSVRTGKDRGKEANLATRRTIYDYVIRNLELELDLFSPRSNKRDRSESPPPISTTIHDKDFVFPGHEENTPSKSLGGIFGGTTSYEMPSRLTDRLVKRQRTPDFRGSSAPIQPHSRLHDSRALMGPRRDVSMRITPRNEPTQSKKGGFFDDFNPPTEYSKQL